LHVLLIHNPGAGDEDHGRDALVRALALAGHEVDYGSTKEPNWIDALGEKPDLIVVSAACCRPDEEIIGPITSRTT
jgi:hypothetical protein